MTKVKTWAIRISDKLHKKYKRLANDNNSTIQAEIEKKL